MFARATIIGAMALLACSISSPAAPPAAAKGYAEARQRMVDEEIVAAGVKDSRVIESMRATPRHEFVPAAQRPNAYYDMALPIGEGQTISPPFVVAYMTEQIDPRPGDKVLEIGTGSGYQAAVLSPLVKEVYSIEIVKSLGETAARTLKRLHFQNVFTRVGDGYQGWPERAPFDKIIVTCSPEKVPPKLVEQLRDGGLMVIPVGERYQQTLYLFRKEKGQLTSEALLPTLFVPMTGRAEENRARRPDPANPSVVNGSFEELLSEASEKTDDEVPQGWHYQRRLTLVKDSNAPEGERFATFTNSVPGRASHALQGLAIDGRKVSEIELSAWVKATDVRQGQTRDELPLLGIVFYDENRAMAGRFWVGPWRKTFDWKRESERIRVPPKAREAILNIGLQGAVGELSLDDVKLKVTKAK